MDTKQQSPGQQTAVLERPTPTPRPDTETVEGSKPIDKPTDRASGNRRTAGVALAAIVLAGATGLFAYRAIEGSSEPVGSADTSHETVEHQRHLSVKPAANGSQLDSFDLADYTWRQRQAGEDSFDTAEHTRMQRLNSEDSFDVAEHTHATAQQRGLR